MQKLTEKQKLFADEYLIDFNATRAYKVAYPKVKNDNSAAACGTRLLRLGKVEEYLKSKTEEFEEKATVTKEQVLQELINIAFADITDLVTVSGSCIIVQSLDEVPKGLTKAIAGIKETKYGLEIKFHDKLKALEMIAKHLGMLVEKVEHSGTISNPYTDLTTEELRKLATYAEQADSSE